MGEGRQLTLDVEPGKTYEVVALAAGMADIETVPTALGEVAHVDLHLEYCFQHGDLCQQSPFRRYSQPP